MMKATPNPGRAPKQALFAAMSLAMLPAMAVAAAGVPSEADRMELENRLRQDEFQRQMDARVRAQEEALRGQEQSIRRLEEARRRLEESSREVAQLSSELGRNTIYNYSYTTPSYTYTTPRALLGVSLDSSGNRRDGALVRQVSPGGAAAEAGIRAGDLIVSLGGDDLTRDSNPGRALVEKMGQIAPDTKVQVGVLRDGKRMNFDVTARAPAVQGLFVSPADSGQLRLLSETLRNIRVPDGGVVRGAPTGAGVVAIADTNRLGGMEFATLSERLGSYFGVKSGVLVVRAGANAPFGLQDGDVILSIDDRAPTNAQHTGRILRSYQPGEKVKLRVQRDRKAVDIDSAAPGERKD